MNSLYGEIREYFTGSISTVSQGFGIFTSTINGTILNIYYDESDVNTTGSILFYESGILIGGQPNKGLFASFIGDTSDNFELNPIVYGTTKEGGSGSPYTFVNPVVNGPILISGISLGNNSIINNIRIKYTWSNKI